MHAVEKGIQLLLFFEPTLFKRQVAMKAHNRSISLEGSGTGKTEKGASPTKSAGTRAPPPVERLIRLEPPITPAALTAASSYVLPAEAFQTRICTVNSTF